MARKVEPNATYPVAYEVEKLEGGMEANGTVYRFCTIYCRAAYQPKMPLYISFGFEDVADEGDECCECGKNIIDVGQALMRFSPAAVAALADELPLDQLLKELFTCLQPAGTTTDGDSYTLTGNVSLVIIKAVERRIGCEGFMSGPNGYNYERPVLSLEQALRNLMGAYGGDIPDWLQDEYDDGCRALKAATGEGM